ncbi:hypothetical protein EDD21DRAFT_220579 [Dissophora ornata]|nr:hypothetical protein EDD21DRAFT_220579 [Dissophora ornata]
MTPFVQRQGQSGTALQRLKTEPTTNAEKQHVLLYTRHLLSQAQESVYFERLIASVAEDKNERGLIEEKETEQKESSSSIVMAMSTNENTLVPSTHSLTLSKGAFVKSSVCLTLCGMGTALSIQVTWRTWRGTPKTRIWRICTVCSRVTTIICTHGS